ncbi:Sulfite exporter TauE-SafE [Spironucleus salmonicida]|uniref:Sulfite exporter TauE-SafE n=1 Tax=Spironucleus salmonicida TaxID=348837 RepID=V6LXM6_9EUKA|nr:Sulfite exporter TauE-SafE [Spironucleus salmonicida]|eukprot:EST49003.1 Sulfite exporter TauE - SafE [Spironucleus salmonicida]
MFFQLVPNISITGEVISCISFFIFSIIASAGGIGGGGIYTSVLIAFGSGVHVAIPLSKLVIFSGSFILFCYNIWQKTPQGTPRIAWDLIFLTENAVVLGGIAGAMVNGVLPQWALLICEVIFLIYQSFTMIKKGVQKLKEDLKKFKQEKQHNEIKLQAEDNLPLPTSTNISQPLLSSDAIFEEEEPKVTKLGHLRQINIPRLFNFVFFYLVQLGLTIGRSIVPTCKTVYWVLLTLNLVVAMLATFINYLLTQRSVAKNQKLLLNADINPPYGFWSFYGRFVGISIVAGVVAAAFGLGGGLVKNPMFISMGVPPLATRNVSGAMIAFTSLASLMQYWVQGQVDISYSWVFMLMLVVGFPGGYFLSDKIIKVVKSTAVIQLAMGCTMVVSCVVIMVQLVKEIIEMVKTGVVPSFRNFCNA